eukprot:541819-Amorphochlora_amoeboformis.AAC.1
MAFQIYPDITFRHAMSHFQNFPEDSIVREYHVLPERLISEQSPGSSDLGHTYHNSVAQYRYLRATLSLAMPLTTMH